MRKRTIDRIKRMQVSPPRNRPIALWNESYAKTAATRAKEEKVRQVLYGMTTFPKELINRVLEDTEKEDRLFIFETQFEPGIRDYGDIEDAILAEHSRTNPRALVKLLNHYAPFIRSLIWKPFDPIFSHKRLKFIKLQQQLSALVLSGGKRVNVVYREDCLQEIIIRFIECVRMYNPLLGTFRGYIKNYLPYMLKDAYERILGKERREQSYEALERTKRGRAELSRVKPYHESITDELIAQFCRRYRLTEKQSVILDMLADNRSHGDIAQCLGITRQGVGKHITIIQKKLKNIGVSIKYGCGYVLYKLTFVYEGQYRGYIPTNKGYQPIVAVSFSISPVRYVERRSYVAIIVRTMLVVQARR